MELPHNPIEQPRIKTKNKNLNVTSYPNNQFFDYYP